MNILTNLGLYLLILNIATLLYLVFRISDFLQGEEINSRHRVQMLSSFNEFCVTLEDRIYTKIKAEREQAHIKVAIASKFAERAFSMASTANVACMALQRSLQVRKVYTPKPQLIANEIAQKEVSKAVGGSVDYSNIDWLYPTLSEDERDIVDNAIRLAEKNKLNGDSTIKE